MCVHLPVANNVQVLILMITATFSAFYYFVSIITAYVNLWRKAVYLAAQIVSLVECCFSDD